jgi:hypothetical protein
MTRVASFVTLAALIASAPSLPPAGGKDGPKLTVDFKTDMPFVVGRHPDEFDTSIQMHAPIKRPQIVAVPQGDTLYIAYQTWDRAKPTDKVVVTKVAFADIAKKKLTAVRVVPSGGTLAGFAVDDKGRDFVLTAKAESFPNNPEGDFVEKIAKTRRKDILILHTEGKPTDLGTETFSTEPIYGVGNAGSGRLVAGGGYLAATYARRHYTPQDKLIHQEANDLLVSDDLERVLRKANNTVSHSFDQRLIFDGTDFVTAHQGDQYPVTGLVVEKLQPESSGGFRPPQFAAFSCPTTGNAVFFELGGLAAEPDGYPVLFTATRNTTEVEPKTVEAKTKLPWDVGLLYLVRDFETKKPTDNPFDAVGAGILAGGYAEPETFTFDNLSWDPAASAFTKREKRTVSRRVAWLTAYGTAKNPPARATAAKFVQLEVGKYLAVWEEHIPGPGGWRYGRTMAAAVKITGGKDAKEVVMGKPQPLMGNPRLHRSDDAVAITLSGKRVAAWVTAGADNRQLALHAVGEDLKHQTFALTIP